MDAKRVDEYHKHGCHFYGKLVVVDYSEDMKDLALMLPLTTTDHYAKAKKFVAERGYTVKRELLGVPEYVVEIE